MNAVGFLKTRARTGVGPEGRKKIAGGERFLRTPGWNQREKEP